MLGGEGNKNGEKNSNRSNQQKKQLCTCSTLFLYISLPLFCTLQRETSRNFKVTRFMEEITCSCSLFFHCRLFSPWWPLAFLIFSIPLQNFMLFPPKNFLYFFYLALALFLVELPLPVALLSLFLCLCLSLFSKFMDMTINLNLILQRTRVGCRNIFRFPFLSVLTLQLSLLHKTRMAIHMTFGIGLHKVGVRTVGVRTLPNFLAFISYQFILAMGLYNARFAGGSSAIKSVQDVQYSLLLLKFGYLFSIK